jgi:hypothetical protein
MTDLITKANVIFASVGPTKMNYPRCPKCNSWIRGPAGTECVICYARKLEKEAA